ncbi:hypothetical protein PVW53_20980, partial [Seohaeicola sp. SP36]|uniref:hypothetical protein n=1 Tax=unclassified Seohaeicola TaxID=2641111 RepID=UPI00237C520D
HSENPPALPVARKGKGGRLLRRPQQAHPAATVADFRTAVLKRCEAECQDNAHKLNTGHVDGEKPLHVRTLAHIRLEIEDVEPAFGNQAFAPGLWDE